MDYATLSLPEVRAGLAAVARDAHGVFGSLSVRQLNWRPDAQRWSVAQCVEHLITANRMMFDAADAAVREGTPRTLWQRLPVWPGLMGRMLIRSQAPTATRKYKTSPQATPASSEIPADVVGRFVAQHREAVTRLDALDETRAAETIMTSPFVRIITYSVLDGWRLVFAHDVRHVGQAQRVMREPGFPGA